MRIEVIHTFHVSVDEAFAYITNMKNWPEYWPGFIRIERAAAASWSDRGEIAGLFDRMLVRPSVEQALRKTVQNLDRRFKAALIGPCSPQDDAYWR